VNSRNGFHGLSVFAVRFDLRVDRPHEQLHPSWNAARSFAQRWSSKSRSPRPNLESDGKSPKSPMQTMTSGFFSAMYVPAHAEMIQRHAGHDLRVGEHGDLQPVLRHRDLEILHDVDRKVVLRVEIAAGRRPSP
jgi:hypothetical protein